MTLQIGAGARPRVTYQKLLDALFAVFVFSGFIAFIEPSPYDGLAFIAFPAWLLGGFRIRRVQLVAVLLWCVLTIAGFAGLMLYLNDPDARNYQFTSLYLYFTAICYTLFFGERSLERAEICLKAYTLGAVVAATIGVLGYFGYAGLSGTVLYERAASTFKDPNVYGSYMILGIAYVVQDLLIGSGWRRIVSLLALGILMAGVFVSFSRGSWGATLLVFVMITVLSYTTCNNSATRRRIVIMSAIVFGVVALVLLFVLSQHDIREFFYQRAVLQTYDEGETGHFGNQLRSIPMLLDHPEGLGPLRFRQHFGLEPHNSYVGAFANSGWLGGFTWIFIVSSTVVLGFRLISVPSLYRQPAQVAWPALFAIILQAFQIDIDHWRQIFLLFGMVWGFEAARQRSMERARNLERPVRGSETYD